MSPDFGVVLSRHRILVKVSIPVIGRRDNVAHRIRETNLEEGKKHVTPQQREVGSALPSRASPRMGKRRSELLSWIFCSLQS